MNMIVGFRLLQESVLQPDAPIWVNFQWRQRTNFAIAVPRFPAQFASGRWAAQGDRIQRCSPVETGALHKGVPTLSLASRVEANSRRCLPSSAQRSMHHCVVEEMME